MLAPATAHGFPRTASSNKMRLGFTFFFACLNGTGVVASKVVARRLSTAQLPALSAVSLSLNASLPEEDFDDTDDLLMFFVVSSAILTARPFPLQGRVRIGADSPQVDPTWCTDVKQV